MSAWGIGITQSDEFMDVADEFDDLYRDDAKPPEVANRILNEYLEEFDAKDSMINTVYFALALRLWECGVNDAAISARIEEIITSGSDLELWEPDPDNKIKAQRKKVLERFYEKLKTEPKNIRKPKKSVKEQKPTLFKGDMFAYATDGGFRAAVVYDCIENTYLTAVSEEIFAELPDKECVLNAYTHTVFWSEKRAIIPKKDRIVICRLDITASYNNRAGFVLVQHSIFGCSSVGKREFFHDTESAGEMMKRNNIMRYTVKELLDPSVLPKYNDRFKI